MMVSETFKLKVRDIMNIINVYSDKIYGRRYFIKKDETYKNIKNKSELQPIDVKFKYNKKLEYFIKTIKEQLPYVDLTVMYNNIEELIISEYSSLNYRHEKTIRSWNGKYDANSNHIMLVKDDKTQSIYHELLHMASRKKEGSITTVGFKQTEQNTSSYIGKGLNEGYTAYLDTKLFESELQYESMFPYILAIKEIVGEENLARYYFNADLNGLIQNLSIYIDVDSIYKFIKNMDILHSIVYNEMITTFYSEKDSNNINTITDENARILLDIYSNKIKLENSNVNDKSDLLVSFANSFCKEVSISNLKIVYVTQENVVNAYNKNFMVKEETSIARKI